LYLERKGLATIASKDSQGLKESQYVLRIENPNLLVLSSCNNASEGQPPTLVVSSTDQDGIVVVIDPLAQVVNHFIVHNDLVKVADRIVSMGGMIDSLYSIRFGKVLMISNTLNSQMPRSSGGAQQSVTVTKLGTINKLTIKNPLLEFLVARFKVSKAVLVISSKLGSTLGSRSIS
jgi:hypothetical protein